MTQQEIQERNKQIALMMGAIDYKADKWYKLGGYKEHIYFPNWNYPNRFLEKDLKFHSDWNWIMEAVEFIENLDLNDIFTMSEFNYHVGKMTLFRVNKDVLKKMPITSKKESIFIEVSDFAKLYNNKEL
jgi:hypothetical protein